MSELKPGWRRVRFGEIAQCVNDRVDDPSQAGVGRYVGLEHLDSDSLKISRWGNPSEVESTKLRFKPGDVVFGKRRAYQRKLAVADFEGICSAHAMVLRAKTNACLPEFLPFLMQSAPFMERAISISVGSLSPTINWRALESEEFMLPPIADQERISRMLSNARIVLEATTELGEASERLILSARERFFDKAPQKPLADLLEGIVAGCSPACTDQPPVGNDYGVLRVSAVGRLGFLPSESKALIEHSAFDPSCSVHAGSLLITRANTPDLVGMSCIVDRDYPSLMLSDKTLRLLPKSGIKEEELLEALWTVAVRRQLKAIATGTGAAMKNISQVNLKGVMVPWLSSIELHQAVEAIQALKASHSDAVNRATEARKLYSILINHSTGEMI